MTYHKRSEQYNTVKTIAEAVENKFKHTREGLPVPENSQKAD